MIHFVAATRAGKHIKGQSEPENNVSIKEEATTIASEMSRKRITPTESGETSDAMLGRYLRAALLCAIGRKLVPEY